MAKLHQAIKSYPMIIISDLIPSHGINCFGAELKNLNLQPTHLIAAEEVVNCLAYLLQFYTLFMMLICLWVSTWLQCQFSGYSRAYQNVCGDVLELTIKHIHPHGILI